MDPRTRDYFARRPFYVQHLLWTLESQGDRIELKQHLIDYKCPPRPKRNACLHFTARARMRMLKFVAGVDWDSETAGQFVTLTYPDSVLFRNTSTTNVHRYVFHRSMENHLHKKISLLWRIEWKPRLTGMFRGKFAPHIHLIVFGNNTYTKKDVLTWWQGAIGSDEWCSVDLEPLSDAKKAGLYVSKYCAKLPSDQSLDKVSYLNKPGRHWGYLRKPLIPLHPVVRFVNLSWECVEKLEKMQQCHNQHYDANKDCGFTMLGDRASRWRDAILKACLADGKLPLYDDEIEGERAWAFSQRNPFHAKGTSD